jgi:integrative and conjugative element protein (TIGR02256 family)
MVTCIAGIQVAFSERVLSLISGFRQRERHAEEAGGILLGQHAQQRHRAAGGRTVLITKASVPSSRDRSGRHSFIRDAETAQIIVDHEHYKSAGRTTYLGEWHTHPERFATPSGRDRRMIARAFQENDLNTDFLLLAIFGAEKDYFGLYDGSSLRGVCL